MSALGAARGSTSAGLYGSQVGARPIRAAVAEFVGTAVLVYVGTSAAVASAARGEAVYDTLAVVLAFGLVLVALVAAFGHVSGCQDRKSTRLNSSHANISYAVFCLKKKKKYKKYI